MLRAIFDGILRTCERGIPIVKEKIKIRPPDSGLISDRDIHRICYDNKNIRRGSRVCGIDLALYSPLLRVVALLFVSERFLQAAQNGLLENVSLLRGAEIRRILLFPPELKQSGLSILNYFGEIIQTKYPDIDVGLRIEQRDDKVILGIETPDGKKELIEQELNEYALVVTGQVEPKNYLSNSDDVMRLEHKLEIAQMEARHAHQLLHKDREENRERILELKDQISFSVSSLEESMVIGAVSRADRNRFSIPFWSRM